MKLKKVSTIKSNNSLNLAIVGLDCSLTDTGLVMLDNDGTVISQASIQTNSGDRELHRQTYITDMVVGLINDHSLLADGVVVFIEQHAYSRSQGKAFTRAEIVGMIRLRLKDMNCGIYTVPPSSIKKYVTGKGNAGKDAVKQGVFRKWGIHYTNDNIADAYALSRYGYALIFDGENLPRECINRLDNVVI